MNRLPLQMLFTATLVWPFTVAQQTYVPPEVLSAGDAYIPYQIVTDGFFVLDISVSDQGEIQRIEALRDPGAMLGAAKTSVHAWKFQPATQDGKAKASRFTVSFLYRPSSYSGIRPVPPKDFTPVIPHDESDGGNDFTPIGILSFDYPDYPVRSVAWGSAVLQVTVDSLGEVKDVHLLHGMSGFNDFAMEALKKWRFRPASLRGKPVASKTVAAFIFQTPHSAH